VPLNEERFLAEKILEAIRNRELLSESLKINESIVEERALWPVCIEKIKEIYEVQLGKN
jgi:glycosyltransferase involved in cell wall biosynthesis